MDDHVIICRCQEITYGEIVQAIAKGATTVTGVKKRVGSGMGICQGKYCEHLVAQIISEKTDIPMSELLPDTKRTPVRPVDASVFLD